MLPPRKPNTLLAEAVPFQDLALENGPVSDEIFSALRQVSQTQRFILGEVNLQFEREMAAYLGVEHALGCANGSDALVLALLAAGVGVDDEVIVPSFTFFATAGAVSRVGATPVFADIDPVSFNLHAPAVIDAAKHHQRVKAIIPVHLFGGSADLDPILEIAAQNGWYVIEDGAQAIGAEYRQRRCMGIGHVGTLSFFPTKNLGAWGDAGMVVTQDKALAERIASLRVHGSTVRYRHDSIGMNSRLDSLQAAILLAKLPHLDAWTKLRQDHAALYQQILCEMDLPIQIPRAQSWQTRHVWNQFIIRTSHRDQLREMLLKAGIGTEIYYPIPLHLQPCYQHLCNAKGDLPSTELACSEVLALPIRFSLTTSQIELICATIADFFQ